MKNVHCMQGVGIQFYWGYVADCIRLEDMEDSGYRLLYMEGNLGRNSKSYS